VLGVAVLGVLGRSDGPPDNQWCEHLYARARSAEESTVVDRALALRIRTSSSTRTLATVAPFGRQNSEREGPRSAPGMGGSESSFQAA
jgi:hypothetical protein